ncbi:hypothetical protein C4K37_3794 [Pseudomonas chlororaphis subsp. piscium]|nr:hypothetical protein C4K37_3794 [Pseudomonas chlororaphis subsp. piscium]AZC44725.1 hypothetical protein C4K36_3802 [Pseudomonas chlororaphis subsp. piscium]
MVKQIRLFESTSWKGFKSIDPVIEMVSMLMSECSLFDEKSQAGIGWLYGERYMAVSAVYVD